MSEIEQTAPVLPWEIRLRNATVFYQQLPDGGMQVKFVPVLATAERLVPMAPAVEISFSPDGWDRFKADIERDGAPSPIVKPEPGLIAKLNGNNGHGA